MIWKKIPGFHQYEVSESGDVRKGETPLTPWRDPETQRRFFSLATTSGIKKRFPAAKLVALAFLERPPFKGAHVCHNDGVEINDHYSNLRWDTCTSNMLDKLKHRGARFAHRIKNYDLRVQADALLAADSLSQSTTRTRRRWLDPDRHSRKSARR